ncbi:hypothetical protein DLAC_08660 [Tieghemostelium lacteum]|uniref:Phytanoyl-CoA dioxygenase n=1 Tax=Tieghemostelium lacteum TaxID=361077 RepID=A0A151Z817_TIELA|nr:hypothetical protein DLAC_08660 [Tieghemostelium lacteum]|eukprot:KYQ90078.1 hypothetical protein DLAC_08660 [Tieghemostelium lacteum]
MFIKTIKTLLLENCKTILEGPLSIKDIDLFKSQGFLIKSGLVPEELLQQHQREIREYLTRNANIDFKGTEIGSAEESKVLLHQENLTSNVSNGFGGMINFYHGTSMYKIRELHSVYQSFSQLYSTTYSQPLPIHSDLNEWPNIYGPFNPEEMFMFVNRCGFRIPHLPETLTHDQLVQKGTGIHLDCNPYHLFKGEKLVDENIELKPLRFWQPIQAFVSLTDTLDKEQGGFWTIPKFHFKTVEYFQNQYKFNEDGNQKLKRGNSFDINDMDQFIKNSLQFIPIHRGDVLFWDWRMPHCNDQFHSGEKVREVIYLAHLPNVTINQQYAQKQKEWYHSGNHPSYVAKKFSTLETNNSYKPPLLSLLGKKLLDLLPWTHK